MREKYVLLTLHIRTLATLMYSSIVAVESYFRLCIFVALHCIATLCYDYQYLLLVRPKTIVFGRTYVLRVMFFSCNTRSPRCTGRLVQNFARWSVLGAIL